MGKINIGRVILGGLLAGLVVNIGETILNVVVLGPSKQSLEEAPDEADRRRLGVQRVDAARLGAL